MTIVSRLELDHPAFLTPGTVGLHTQIEGLYTDLGDHIDTRFFRVLNLANSATATVRHNFLSPFGAMFIKVWGYNEITGALTEVDQSLYTIADGGANPTEEIDITNNTGGEVDIAVSVFNSNQRLDELRNVSISGITTGQVLQYDTGTKLWTPVTVLTTLAALTDTTITAPATGHILTYNGSIWVNLLNSIDNLTNTTITTPATGHILRYNGSIWVNLLNSVDNLTNTTITTPANGQVLTHNGSIWVNLAIPAQSISALSDTTITAPAEGHLLHYDNGTSKWINSVAQVPTLAALTDTTITAPAEGHLLHYDNGTSKWINSVPTFGPKLYAAIVDAAGNGDYTTILAAIAGETTGTIYIKNGTYVENTQLVLKKNLHLVGESREGVLITTTANQFLLYTDQHTPSDVSQLLANRSDWDAATGDGTATVGAGSTTVTISTAAITGSETGFIILDGAPYEITSTAGPSSVFLVDGHTGSALANAPYQIRPGSFRDETRVENLTVIGSNSSGEILRVRNVVGFHAKNLKLIQDVDASAGAKVLCHSSFDCSFDKIECLNTNNSGFAANSGFKLYDNCRVKVTNSSVHRANFPVEFGDAGGFKPNYYCFFQFDNLLSNAGSVLAREASFFKSRFDVKNMRDHAGFAAMMSFTLSGCANYSEFHFGVLESGNAQRGIDQSATNNRNNIYYCGRVATAHATAIQIQSSATASETNMIQSGDFRGQISINNSVVGVCIYDSITGTPRANAGFEF